MPLAPGTFLGPYQIGAPLGAGGMGEVYRARDTRLDRTVAIKTLPQQFSNDPVRKQRFEREAKTISSLNHPHICVFHDVGHQDGIDYLVMECLEGETLAKRLERGTLPHGGFRSCHLPLPRPIRIHHPYFHFPSAITLERDALPIRKPRWCLRQVVF